MRSSESPRKQPPTKQYQPGMKSSLEDQPPAHVAIETPQSYESKNDDQELGANNITISNGNVLINQPSHALYRSLIRKVLAEALGSFIVVFSVCAILTSIEVMGIKGGLMEYAATSALSVIVVVFGLGEISGAHVNPAVTIAFATVGSFPWFTVVFYVLAQLGGCVLGSFAGRLIYGTRLDLLMTKPLQGWAAAFSAEFIATSILVFLAASLSRDPQFSGPFSGFVIGAAIGLGVILTGPVSGGSLNPARSLGPAIVTWDFDQLWIYLVAPTLGAIFGGILYRALRLQGWACHPSPSSSR